MGLAVPSHAQAPAATSSGTGTQEENTPAATAAGASSAQTLQAVTVVGTVDDLQSLDFYAPNSSAVITRQDIEEQGARKLDQALHYQAGILAEPFGADNKVEWFKIRGFDASVSLDGTPTTPNGYFVWKPEIFGVESVEILKGPNSLVFGASEAGGVVNLVTKRPHKKESLLLNAEIGSRERLGVGVDYNGIANSDGSVYYRIVAQARRQDGMQRRTDMKSYYLAPSVTFDFSERTSLTLLTSIQHEDGRPTNGFLPAYGTIIKTPHGRIDRRLNAGEPDFDRLKRTQTSAGWLLSHQFADDWTFTQNYKFSLLDIDQRNVFAWSSDGNRELLRGYTFTDGDTKNHYIDNRVSGSLRLGDAVELLPTFGIDYLKSDTSGQNNGFGWAPNLDMFSPVYGAPFAVDSTPYKLDSKQLGVYAAAQLRVGANWNFNAGIRHDRAKSHGTISNADSRYDVTHNSANVGAMYISEHGISPYVSYSESFKPVAGVDGYGNTYQPYEGQQTEVGIKLEPSWLNGTITLARFDVEEKNALISDASNIQTQSGKRTNKGVELQGDFKVTPNTTVKASYTRNNSRQDITDTLTVRTPLLPKHQASLWVSHRFDLPNSQGLTVAAGARYNGSTEDQRYYPGERIPSYTLFDLLARYQIDRDWALQLNARNLTDKTYVSGCDFYCYYGGERTVDLQLQYQWR
ncbi:TonB-dependent siderophore receptor [Pseudothauera nasutitermitis]|uniref:TonB-dependent siderophore receptor n=2 Tax=Pseudothauera nasutitermitis TaxID=2565930 RepID=A0A4S4B247_9RHOO|nr:TonB-dependent siderophore receptor [Pseudothauera nasutitermitis]